MSEETPRAEGSPPHPAIRGMRAMAVVRWALLVAVALLAAGTWWQLVLRDEGSSAREDRYYCPMHPQIRSPDPGECPICYMRLEPIPERGTGADHDAHAHGEPDAPGAADPVPVMLTTERRQLAGIATAPARREPIAAGARWPASVEAREGARAEVRVRADAYVERLVVREPGVVVRPGRVLAWVYSPEILRAAEELRTARGWASAPIAAGEPAPSAVDAARERLLLLGVAPGDVDRLLEGERAPRTVPLRAPIGGHVTRLEAVLGAYATPQTVLFEITDLSRVRVVASVYGEDVALARPGAVARFLPRDGGEPVPLELELIEPRVEGDARTTRARFLARNPGMALRPGQIGEVAIEAEAIEALVVPRDAVVDTGRRRYVYVAREGGLFEPRAVEIGALRGERRVITSGLEEGELVVVRGVFVLDSESRLEAALAPARAATTGPGHAPGAEPEEAAP